uniref:WGS project CAEQ00000000 data, annotated contig 31 n=1 Tax=Trypanosoma congolense (strain IL3000) TaxID=1068625 RepID=F9WET9_TRYCI|nr:unnamed protein product [Trypanosoma congolense IL3000]
MQIGVFEDVAQGKGRRPEECTEKAGKSPPSAQVRVLSYNFNILPRGCGGFQKERIQAFLETTDGYDVIMLQEVYAATLLPHFMQKYICFQKTLVDELRRRGFHNYVISKQPSYTTIIRNNVLSDNGLIIASRFPIGQRGSYTFRSHERVDQSVRRGCLFAEVKVPVPGKGEGVSETIIFFNVHLRQEDGVDATLEHVKETRQFAASVLRNICSNPEDVAKVSFVLAGDFNVNGINLHDADQPTKKYEDLVGELQSLNGGVREIVFEARHHHPPTRPTKLFFPTKSKLNRSSLSPQRQDYFFVSPTVGVKKSAICKFVSNSQQPYAYLSDHFGVSAVLTVPHTVRQKHSRTSSLMLLTDPESEEVVHEKSNLISGNKVEIVLFVSVILATFYFSWPVLLCLGLAGIPVWWLLSPNQEVNSEQKLVRRRKAHAQNNESEESELLKSYETLRDSSTVGDVWRKTVHAHSIQRCLGQKNAAGVSEWLAYGAVDARVRELASGLFSLGVTPGDVIGVDCDASVDAVVLELACAAYGFPTLTLLGNDSVMRNLIDDHNVKVVFASRNAVGPILTCRSRNLETVVCMHSFYDTTDALVARDVCITLTSFDEVFCRGRLQPVHVRPRCDGSTLFTLVVDPSTCNSGLEVVRVTHADALRTIRTLVSTAVLPNTQQKQLLVHYTPFSVLFNRLFVLGLFSHGSAVVATPATSSAGALVVFQPTVMLATPSLFSSSTIQLRRRNERYGRLYTWLFEQVYQLRSILINVHCRDSLILRSLFFYSTQHQFGGKVEKIVMCSSDESLSDELEEHIVVCYAPCLRNVFFQPSEGVFCVDGVPAPGVRARLEPFSDKLRGANMGKLVLSRDDGEDRVLPVAATWSTSHTLRLLGPSDSVLLPDKSDYILVAGLERLYSQSRYANDVFLYANPSRPLIAIVSLNRDTVEFEWRRKRQVENAGDGNPLLNWSEFAGFATELLLADFRSMVKRDALPDSNVPSFVHIHPHAFKKHNSFLTPYGGMRRCALKTYFKAVIEGFYSDEVPQQCPIPCPSYESEEEAQAHEDEQTPFLLNVPIAVDIGGTFAKVVYVQPPGDFKVPHYVVHEAGELPDGFSGRMLHLLKNPKDAKKLLTQDPSSTVGSIRLAKMSSKCIPDFMSYLVESGMLGLYSEKYRNVLRVTGGGAFKYAALASKEMKVCFSVVKEMSAVVHGLGAIIRTAPEAIFTVDPITGDRHPHRLKSSSGEAFSPYPCLLVNIGSGISIIKCIGPDGSHIRIGGSPLGGATFWGLVRSMTNVSSWEEIMEAMRLDGPGDNKNVDLLVGDIYGYNAKDLPAMLSVDTVASTFGKVGTERFYEKVDTAERFHTSSSDDLSSALSSTPSSSTTSRENNISALSFRGKTSEIDIVRSLLNMISSNVTQLAYLHSRVQDVHNILFAGGFVRNNPIVWSHISSSMGYWSKGECHAHFLRHDSHLGALGAAINTDEEVS